MIPFGCRTQLRVLSYVSQVLITDRRVNNESLCFVFEAESHEMNNPGGCETYVKPETAEHRDPKLQF